MKQLVNDLMHLFSNAFVLAASILVIAGLAGFVGVKALGSHKNTQVSASSCQVTCVAITANGINPDTLSVKVGEFVQINTADDKKHNISMGKGDDGRESADHAAHDASHDHVGDFESGDFGKGEAWKVQFKKAGTYHLHDHYNPKNQILVVVYQPGVVNKIQ